MLDGLEACNQGKHADLKNCTSYEHVHGQFKSEFLLYYKIRFSQVMRLFDEFLDILESLECVLQSIFEMQIEIPSGSVWKMTLKWGRKPCQNRLKFH